MKSLLFVAFLFGVALLALGAEDEYIRGHTSWTINSKDQLYINDDTKVSFTKAIAGFRLYEAKPATEDGSAKFTYHGTNGFITLYHMPRAVAGNWGRPDFVRRYVDAVRDVMKKGNGRFDSEKLFTVTYQKNGKRGTGYGATYHFLASPENRGQPVYDEFGAVQIGEFMYTYRGSFLNKAGFADLARFLQAAGFKKT
jgi:hypothetical protein